MDGVVVEHLVVDLVGHQHEVVTPREVGDADEGLARVDGAGGVVRVDDDDHLRAVRDLGLQVLEVRVPVVRLVAAVVHGHAAGEVRDGGPQRVVGDRDEHLVAVVEQRLQRERDELGDPVAEPDVVDLDRREAVLQLVVVHDGSTCGLDAARVGVALRGGQAGDDVLQDLGRCVEPERRRVADVQLEDAVPLRLQGGGSRADGSADVVEDIPQLFGLAQRRGHAHILPDRLSDRATPRSRLPGVPRARRPGAAAWSGGRPSR